MSQVQANIYKARYHRMREVLENAGGTVSFAKRMGVSKAYVSRLLGPGERWQNISEKFARRVESEFSLAIGSLDVPLDKPDHDATILVPMLDLSRPGADSTGQVMTEVRISKSWVRSNTEVNDINQLAIISAQGDSMEPTFPSGSVLLVDRSVAGIHADGIYAFSLGEDVWIKRVQRNLDGSLTVKSDNERYTSDTVSKEDRAKLTVHGRVVAGWVPRKF